MSMNTDASAVVSQTPIAKKKDEELLATCGRLDKHATAAARKELCELLPEDSQNARVAAAFAKIATTAEAADAAVGVFSKEGTPLSDRVLSHTGQDGEACKKLADIDATTPSIVTRSKIAHIAPTANPGEMQAATAEMQGYQHHHPQYQPTQQWQGPPTQQSDPVYGATGIFGHSLFNQGNFLGPGNGQWDSLASPGGQSFVEGGKFAALRLLKQAFKPTNEWDRKRTYVGDDSVLPRDDINKLIRGFEGNTGQNLDKMPVLANKQQVMRNIARYYVPKTIRQVPSKAWRAVSSIHPQIGLGHLLNATMAATEEPGDFYHGANGTVNVGKGNVGTLAHETGHWVDRERRAGPYRRGIFGGYKDQTAAHGSMNVPGELAATLWARKAMGEDAWKSEGKGDLEPALGSYLAGTVPTGRKLGEWWKNVDNSPDPKWKTNLPKALKAGDNKASNLAFRRALQHVMAGVNKHFGETGAFAEEDPTTGKLKWLDPKKHQLDDLTKMLLDHEWKRTYGKKASLNVSAVGEGDYSKLKVVPHSTFGPKVLEELEGRMNSKAKQSPCSKLQDMDLCEESDGLVHEKAAQLEAVAKTMDEGKYRQDMVKIAGMLRQGVELCDALEQVKGLDPRHARYQAHIWEERLNGDGHLYMGYQKQAAEEPAGVRWVVPQDWNGKTQTGSFEPYSVPRGTDMPDGAYDAHKPVRPGSGALNGYLNAGEAYRPSTTLERRAMIAAQRTSNPNNSMREPGSLNAFIERMNTEAPTYVTPVKSNTLSSYIGGQVNDVADKTIASISDNVATTAGAAQSTMKSLADNAKSLTGMSPWLAALLLGVPAAIGGGAYLLHNKLKGTYNEDEESDGMVQKQGVDYMSKHGYTSRRPSNAWNTAAQSLGDVARGAVQAKALERGLDVAQKATESITGDVSATADVAQNSMKSLTGMAPWMSALLLGAPAAIGAGGYLLHNKLKGTYDEDEDEVKRASCSADQNYPALDKLAKASGPLEGAYLANVMGFDSALEANRNVLRDKKEGKPQGFLGGLAAVNQPTLELSRRSAANQAASKTTRWLSDLGLGGDINIVDILSAAGGGEDVREQARDKWMASGADAMRDTEASPDKSYKNIDAYRKMMAGQLADSDYDIAFHKHQRSERPKNYWLNPFDRTGPLNEVSDRLFRRSTAYGGRPETRKGFWGAMLGDAAGLGIPAAVLGNHEAQQRLRELAQKMKLYGAGEGEHVARKSKKDKEIEDVPETDFVNKRAAAPDWVANLASKAQSGLAGLDPTLKTGLVGAGVGGVGGAGIGALSSLTGGSHAAITPEVAAHLSAIGVPYAIVQKLMDPEELSPEEIEQLSQSGVVYDDIAPKASYAGNMIGNTAIGGALGVLGGGALGAGAQEIPRWMAGHAVANKAGDAAAGLVPDLGPQAHEYGGATVGAGVDSLTMTGKNMANDMGQAAGRKAWDLIPRKHQFGIAREGMGGQDASSLIDKGLGTLAKSGHYDSLIKKES